MTKPETWRELSETEWRAAGGHRPVGPLSIMFAAAGVLTIIGAFLAYLLLQQRLPIVLSGPMTPQQVITLTGLAVVLSTFLWGLGCFVSILTRASHGPIAIAGLTGLWALTAIGAQFVNAYAITGGTDPAAYLPHLPNALFHLAIAAGVCGYVLDGFRPNLYFRRRIRVS
ncbi:hypothetical protein GJW-30_1_02609 [Variibacter gotjawalensis]|uniref:Uncharacterized protein n=1 Tax=Variibacter gotjawalensis TaxID=1333996 RepID=A0A0S3PVU9_9BRAD|nr:hypothetical protein [Variibacter gotjawalensis]NIK45900.1 putative membrane protein [Variibacter gotjawalensis]RZS47820.1 hypothetical protein EV661_0213 [Variibacter gotjawalensis]BAT60074.1 hypothetical protein GJW-30_1_02609 [Variibacter gotjawalensis]